MDLFEVIPPVFAGACAIAYARCGTHNTRSHRVGWFNIGLGCLSFAIGDTLAAFSGVTRGVDTFLPGWWNIGYLATYPFLIGGVILLFGSINIAERARLLVDSAIAASSAGILSWYCLMARLWQQSNIKLISKIINVAYPLGDMAALFGAIVLVVAASRGRQMRRSALLLSGGLVLLTLGDSFFTFYGLNNTYQVGSWVDSEWAFGWILIGYACLLPLWWPHAEGPPAEIRPPTQLSAGQSLVRILIPYVAVAASILVVAIDDYHRSYVISIPVLILEASLITLVILRQILTIIENQRLAFRMQRFNAELENVVGQRTQQLTALYQLTTAVNSTLQIDQVLPLACNHTLAAMGADAVVISVVGPEFSECRDTSPTVCEKGFKHRPEALTFIRCLPACESFQVIPLEIESGVSGPANAWVLQAPLLWQTQIVGTVSVVRWACSFEGTEPDMLRSIGVEVGAAVENARSYSLAREAADRCPVTALLNHRAIHQRLDAELSQSKRSNRPLAVIMIDVNDFKLFNDTHGHPTGDQVLKRVAAVLNAECREYDVVGRYGGDEFLAVLPGSDADDAATVAHRLRVMIGEDGFSPTGEIHSVPVSLSFGVAAYPDDGANRHELLSRADANLYAAKYSDVGVVRSSESQRTNRTLKNDGSFEILDAMVTAVDNKDRYTRRHSEDVTEYALWTAEELALSDETMRLIRAAGLLHDVGKIGVPAHILGKPDGLT
ncbi:MAG: diguanylate cyclase, partial [Armatimonadota bacterium]|nr:diguanylate cyclase [Armatimonadota bacterium]